MKIYYPLDAATHKQVTSRYGELQATAEKYNIHLGLDGHFSGAAKGAVEIAPSMVTIEVTDHPFFIAEFMIRHQLSNLLDEFFHHA
jgi:hypothetical protein